MSPHMIDEVNASKKSYIHETPQYVQWGFLGQQDKRFMNRKSDGGHPFSQQPSQTYFEDPLVVGSTKHYGNFLDYNNRAVESSTKHLNGGALMYQQPKGGMMSDSDYCSDSSSDMEGGEMDEECGAGIYNDYVKPAGKFLGHVGKEIISDVIVPVGKELVKDAVKKVVKGGKRGRPKGSKNKSKMVDPPVVEALHLEHLVKPKKKGGMMRDEPEEYEEVVFQPSESDPAYLRQIDKAHRGEVAHLKDEIAKLLSEKSRVEGEKKFEEGMIKADTVKIKRKPRKKVLKNIEDELHRVEGETKTERAKMAVEKLLQPKKSKKERAVSAVAELVSGAPKKERAKRGMTEKAKERVEIVKKVMKEQGLKLGPASKYVKDHNLWKPATGEWF